MRSTIILIVLLTCVVQSQERIVLTTPPPVTTEYRIATISFQWNAVDRCVVNISLAPNGAGEGIGHSYGGTQACDMLRALNTANLSTRSLKQRIFDRLIADKVIDGTVSGNPE